MFVHLYVSANTHPVFLRLCRFIMYAYHTSAFYRYIIINYNPSVAVHNLPPMKGSHHRSSSTILSAAVVVTLYWHAS